MSDVRKITEVQFQPWEPHNIIPDMKRGWPDPIQHVAATHAIHPPKLDGTMTDPLWNDAAVVEPTIPFEHDNPLTRTQVYLAWDIQSLYIGVRAEMPDVPNPPEPGSDAEHDRLAEEKVMIALDVHHNHDQMKTISVNALGQIEWHEDGMLAAGFSNEIGFQSYGWLLEKINPDPAGRAEQLGVRGTAHADDKQWTAELAIPLASLDAEFTIPGVTMGLNVIRAATERPAEKFTYFFNWTPQYPGVLSSPVKMGVMSLGPVKIRLEAVDFPNCSWGVNHAAVRLKNDSDEDLNVVMISRGRCGPHPDITHVNEPVETGPVALPAGKSVDTTVEYHMPVRFLPSYIELEVRDRDSGDRLLHTTYRVGTCAVVYPFGQEKGMPTPDVHDPDFIEKRMRYIVSRQPLLRRRTTRQGAPSDFYIEAVDGSVAFDLMQDGVMDTIGDWLRSLYDNDEDLLIGSAFFMAQQAVYVYTSRRAIFSTMINPLSNLRLGGGMCGEFGRSLVGLLHHIKSIKTGKPFRARSIGVGGHSLTTVWIDDRWVLIDPTTCNVKAFFRRDHKSLASGQDLRNDPSLITKNGSTTMKFANPLLVHSVVAGQTWPDGAPSQ